MLRFVLPLSLIGGLRFFGLFVIMPVIAVYASNLDSNFDIKSSTLVGLAVGSYAISQIIFQIPFGYLGDKYSKRHLIAFGLFVFIVGSLICAFATSIEMLILGRIIQGAGAFGSLINAKISDLIREENRGNAMAFLGITIFMSFILAMVVGPKIGIAYGVDKLFLLTAALSLFGIIILYATIPKASHMQYTFHNEKTSYMELLKDRNIFILNISVLLQKFLMTFAFTLIPVMLVRDLGMVKDNIWIVFSLSALAGFVALAPGMIISEKYKQPKAVLIFGIVLFAISYLLMGFGDSNTNLVLFVIGAILFFCAFCIQEPILQNLASKYPKIHQKSLSLGIFTTFGYLGSFFGGMIGGVFFYNTNFTNIAICICIVMFIWAFIMYFLKNPRDMKNLYLDMNAIDSSNINKLQEIDGVIETYINKTENLLIIKFDDKKVLEDNLIAQINDSINSR